MRRNDEYMATKVFEFYLYITNHGFFSFVPGLVEYINAHSSITQYRTPSILLVLAYYLYSNQFVSHSYSVNKYMYKLNRLANGSMSFDISTCKLWYALVLITKKDYLSCLKIVNEVLSTIPSYALLFDLFSNNASNESNRLYENRFYSSNTTYSQRARTAWTYVLSFRKDVINNVPLAIQVELRFCEYVNGVLISPITCTYYLLFLCYHDLRQKENRDRGLRLLMTVVNIFPNYVKGAYITPSTSPDITCCWQVSGAVQMFMHSDVHKLCPSPSRHISVLIRSRTHTVFALNWKEKN